MILSHLSQIPAFWYVPFASYLVVQGPLSACAPCIRLNTHAILDASKFRHDASVMFGYSETNIQMVGFRKKTVTVQFRYKENLVK